MMISNILKNSSLGLFILFALSLKAKDLSNCPNFIVIVVDDMRFDQMTHAGHPYIETPHLDSLAETGNTFTKAYVTSPLCGPSRASLFTARLPRDHGRINNFIYTENLAFYLPNVFREQGYNTAMIGKFYERQHAEKPEARKQFDRWVESVGPDWSQFQGDRSDAKQRMAFYNANMYYDQVYNIDGKNEVLQGHQTDVLFDQAIRYVNALKDKPYFMIINPFAPHTPLNPSPRNKDRYSGQGIPTRPNQAFEQGWFGQNDQKDYFEFVSERMAEMIKDVDEGLGRLVHELKSNGQWDGTMLVFTSDNGTQMGEHGFGWKRHPWEESIRVPFIMHDPFSDKKGEAIDELVSLADILVTFADAANLSLPEDSKRYGRSFLGALRDNTDYLPRDFVVIEQFPQDPNQRKVRYDYHDWLCVIDSEGNKAIRYQNPPVMRPELGDVFLFSLDKDPFEMTNLADPDEDFDAFPQITEHLEAFILQGH